MNPIRQALLAGLATAAACLLVLDVPSLPGSALFAVRGQDRHKSIATQYSCDEWSIRAADSPEEPIVGINGCPWPPSVPNSKCLYCDPQTNYYQMEYDVDDEPIHSPGLQNGDVNECGTAMTAVCTYAGSVGLCIEYVVAGSCLDVMEQHNQEEGEGGPGDP